MQYNFIASHFFTIIEEKPILFLVTLNFFPFSPLNYNYTARRLPLFPYNGFFTEFGFFLVNLPPRHKNLE